MTKLDKEISKALKNYIKSKEGTEAERHYLHKFRLLNSFKENKND